MLILAKLKVLRRGALIGILNSSERSNITNDEYAKGKGYETVEHILFGLWPWEQDIFNIYFSELHNILVAGVGGGREAIALANHGFNVTAFDSCEALTKACRFNIESSGLTIRVLNSAPDCVPAECLSEPLFYDGIYVGRGCYHHILGRSRRISFLKDCRQLIGRDKPLFLSDFFTRNGNDRSYNTIRIVANAIRRFMRRPDPVELGDWLTDCMQHAFVFSEIESELGEAGFQLAHYSESPCGPGTNLSHAVGISQ